MRVAASSQGGHDRGPDALDRGVDLRARDLEVADFGVVEGTGVVADRRVTLGTDVVEDAFDDVLGAQVGAEGGANACAHARGQRARSRRPVARAQRAAPRRADCTSTKRRMTPMAFGA